MSDYPNLAPAELEALALLMEECAEVAAIIGKALRHGLDEHHPNNSTPNRDLIAEEAGQVMASIDIACRLGVLDRGGVIRGETQKWRNVGAYLHHIDIDIVNRWARAK